MFHIVGAPRNPCRAAPRCWFNPSCRAFTVSLSLCFVPCALGDEVITLNMIKSAPVGPVAGGIMGCIMVLVLAVYAYRHQIHRRSHQHMSPLAAQGELNSAPNDTMGMKIHPAARQNPKEKQSPSSPRVLSQCFAGFTPCWSCRSGAWRWGCVLLPSPGYSQSCCCCPGSLPRPKGR